MRLCAPTTKGRHGVTLALGLAVGARALAAADDKDEDVWKNMFSSFATPMGQLFDGTADESLNARYAFDMPLKSSDLNVAGFGNQGEAAASPTMQFGLKYVPLTSWFISVTALKYLRPQQQKSWSPDFTYVFGYDDWRPYTFSAQYSNYGGNRFRPDASKHETRTDFASGSWNMSYKFPMPELLNGIFLISPEDMIGCSVGATLTHRYSDLASNSVMKGKRIAALGCKYTFPGNWYFNFAIPTYLVPKQQQPWDPDYTYGFGYFDWHPGTWSIQYNNYSGNRFPGSKRGAGTGRFKDGSISISIGHSWL